MLVPMRAVYNNEIVLGSKRTFTGKDKYFTQHGNYEILDFFAAMEQGYVEDSNGFWGMDDATVFSIAKEKVSLAAQRMGLASGFWGLVPECRDSGTPLTGINVL